MNCVEYWVTNVVEMNSGRCRVAGRIVEGSLKVGTIFTYVATPKFIGAQKAKLRRENRRDVSLKVVGLEFHGKAFNELYAGDTPGVEIIGENLGLIRDHVLLGVCTPSNLEAVGGDGSTKG